MGANNIKYTQEKAKEIFKKYGYNMLEEYVRSKDRVKCSDDEGYLYRVGIINIQAGEKSMAFHANNPYTIYNIKNYIKLNCKDSVELISEEYKNNTKALVFKCLQCGEKFQKSWGSFTAKPKLYKCTSCILKDVNEKQRFSIQKIYPLFLENNLVILDTDYKNSMTPINVMDFNGYLGKISYNNLSKGKMFERFSLKYNEKNYLYNIMNYTRINNIKSKPIKVIGSDGHGHTSLLFKCECGNDFKTIGTMFTNKNKIKCDKCSSAISKIELKIIDLLEENNIDFIREHSFVDCRNIKSNRPLFFDFYLKEYNLCIECDGRQHYQKVNFGGMSDEKATIVFNRQKEYDNIKNKYCMDNDIQLIRIPYYEFDSNIYIERISKFLPINV